MKIERRHDITFNQQYELSPVGRDGLRPASCVEIALGMVRCYWVARRSWKFNLKWDRVCPVEWKKLGPEACHI